MHVRFEAHNGLKSDMAPCPKSANEQTTDDRCYQSSMKKPFSHRPIKSYGFAVRRSVIRGAPVVDPLSNFRFLQSPFDQHPLKGFSE